MSTVSTAWLPFEEARAFARRLGLKSYTEWSAYSRSGKRPGTIPAHPEGVYKGKWKNWGDWLGTGTVVHAQREFLPFEEARAFVHSLHLKDNRSWQVYCTSGDKPATIPSTPWRVYKEKWKSFGDWLGTGSVATYQREYLPFEEARAFTQSLRLRSVPEWTAYCTSGDKPTTIPRQPDTVYKEKWKSFGDWLGTGTVAPFRREFLPFEEARAFVHSLHLKNSKAWHNYCTSGEKPADIPSSPDQVYCQLFRGWQDWFGTQSRWTTRRLLAFLADLRGVLGHLDEHELYLILEQGGALPAFRMALQGASPMQVLRDLIENDGERIERALRGAPGAEDTTMSLESTEDLIGEEGDLSLLWPTPLFEYTDERLAWNAALEADDGPSAPPEAECLSSALLTLESLRAIDRFVHTPGQVDERVVEYLIANRVSFLWERYSTEGGKVLETLLAGDGGPFFQEIKRRFLSEVARVEQLPIPDGWSFTTLAGERALPNAMQRRTAWSVKERRRVGNWSGPGAGKTLAGVLASRVCDAQLTLIVTNSAAIKGWKRQILAAYPDSHAATVLDEKLAQRREGHHYLILNYERFQGDGRTRLVQQLFAAGIDLVILDEVQMVKQRDGFVSQRRETLASLLEALTGQNPEMRVLVMSATPVINNLQEGKKLLELLVGREFPELKTSATVYNSLALHRALMHYGFRYRPPYEQEVLTTTVITVRNDLLPALLDAQGSILQVEQTLLSAKLDAVRARFCRGTLVYSLYVDEMVAPIRRYLERMGLSVGIYTGSEKSGLADFLAGHVDVLVGSKPLGTGLDGLQTVCDRIVMLSLPWTGAEYEQIIGRLVRQGSRFKQAEIIVPQVVLDVQGDRWSWDHGRMACIQFKQTLAACVVDGEIPEMARINQHVLLQRSREALERWIQRVSQEAIA